MAGAAALIPISLGLNALGAAAPWVFVTAALAIVPAAWAMGVATEDLARRMGPALGGLLNATFGNAAELIITLAAVRAGELDVVRASLIGSIVGNILLVLGLSVLLGGLKYRTQRFNEDAAGVHTVMMMLAVVALLTPSLFVHAAPGMIASAANPRVEALSLGVSGLLILLYLGSLVFSLHTHQDFFRSAAETHAADPVRWSRATAVGVLAAATAVIAVESEVMVRHLDSVVAAWGMNKLFVGVILVPIVGNAAEHATAVAMALKNKMDISLNIAVSSSTQIAFFVAPIVVFASVPLGHAVPYVFNTFELIAVAVAALIASLIARDGQCHWLEGAQLLVVYLILAMAFYFIPG
jgi:Ca2+:H+ antiporter